MHDYLIEKGKDYKLNRLLQQERSKDIEVQKCTFKPTLSELTQKLVKVHKLPVFKRLSEDNEMNLSSKKVCNIDTQNESKFKFTKAQNKEEKASSKHNSRYQDKSYESEDTEFKMEVDEDQATSEKIDPQDYDSESVPQLFIDVHLDDMSIHRLTIFEGDDPQLLAKNFCKKYGKLCFLT